MVAITALAHLRAAVLYFVDISEQCGHSISAQLDLFRSISPLFSNKPLMIVQTKTDVVKPEQLDPAAAALFNDLREQGIPIGSMSSLTEASRQLRWRFASEIAAQQVGVMDVRNSICDALLAQRNDKTMRSAHFRTGALRCYCIRSPLSPTHARSAEPAARGHTAAARPGSARN